MFSNCNTVVVWFLIIILDKSTIFLASLKDRCHPKDWENFDANFSDKILLSNGKISDLLPHSHLASQKEAYFQSQLNLFYFPLHKNLFTSIHRTQPLGYNLKHVKSLEAKAAQL